MNLRVVALCLFAALALAAQPHIVVSTDLGGDPDDIQSLYRLLHYSDQFTIEGIISSPGPGATNSADKIRRWIGEVRIDQIRANGHPELISEQQALELVEQGATRRSSSRTFGATGPRPATLSRWLSGLTPHSRKGTLRRCST